MSGGGEGRREEKDAVFEAAAGEPGTAAADGLISEDLDVQVTWSDPGARDPDGMAAEGGVEARINDANCYLQMFELYETHSVRKTDSKRYLFLLNLTWL